MDTKTDLKDIIAHGALVIDVRTVDEYKNGHIDGSLNIPLDEIQGATSWLIKDAPMVTVCASGSRSEAAKKILESNGYKKVYNGGAWNNFGEMKIGSCPVK